LLSQREGAGEAEDEEMESVKSDEEEVSRFGLIVLLTFRNINGGMKM
jgi:hypothetical protein